MQLTSTFALLASALSAIPAMAVALSARQPGESVFNYDTRYDDPKGSLSTTSCSANVGVLEGHTTFGSIPSYPHIVGSILAGGFNSPLCGACFNLTFTPADGGKPTVIPFTVMNDDQKGFTSSVQGLNDLTGYVIADFPGDVPIKYEQVASHYCGF
jgi:hypothetical protein